MRKYYRYRFGSAVYDEAKPQLLVDGNPVRIAPRQRKLLSVLLSSPTKVVGRDELLDRVWGYNNTDIDSHALTAAIDRLRKCLGAEGNAIRTIHGQGYRFDAVPSRELVKSEEEFPLSLEGGGSVPRREDFLLVARLGTSDGIEVWSAENRRSGERRVYKFAADRERLRHLKHEARSAALLSRVLGARDDLVRMIASGFEEPPYFLEFEYGGDNLLDWSRTQDDLARMDRSARIALFLEIADALGALHSIPFVHADIKPKNILVYRDGDGRWRPRIVDFGSSRVVRAEFLQAIQATEMSLVQAGSAASDPTRGTFMYMAPEIWRGEQPTLRSDLFSLGILLYQLVVGDLTRRPDSGWQREISEPLLVADIEQAIDADPNRRFASVSELAGNLRSLEQRSVAQATLQAQHQRNEALQRLVDRARTRRPWLIGTLALMSFSILAVSGLLAINVRTTHSLQRELDANQAFVRFIDQDFFAMADPVVVGRSDVTVLEAAQKAAIGIDQRFKSAPPEVRTALHRAMQQTFLSLSRYDASIDEGRKALGAMSEAGIDDISTRVATQEAIADGLRETSRFDAARAQLDEIEPYLGHPKIANSDLAVRYWYSRGQFDLTQYAFPKAIENFERAAVLAKSAASVTDMTRDQLALSYADAQKMSGNFSAAEQQFRALRERQTARFGPKDPRTCETSMALGGVLGYLDRFDEAVPITQAAVECLERTLGHDNVGTGIALDILGSLYFQQDNYTQAVAPWERSLEIFRKRLDETSLRVLTTQANVALALQYAGRPDRAEGVLQAALNHARGKFSDTDAVVQSMRYSLADIRLDLHKTESVEALLRGLKPQILNQHRLAPDWEGRIAYQQGRLALLRGDKARAVAFLKDAAHIIGEKNPDGRISPKVIAPLIAKASGKSA